MIAVLRRAVRSRWLAALLLAALSIPTLRAETATAASMAPPTVGDYLVHLTRALGVEGAVPRDAPAGSRLAYLVRQGYLSAELAAWLRLETPLTREAVLRLSLAFARGFGAPSFLSDDYVAGALLAAQGSALGFLRGSQRRPAILNTFAAELVSAQSHCPTPRRRTPPDPNPPRPCKGRPFH